MPALLNPSHRIDKIDVSGSQAITGRVRQRCVREGSPSQ
jgi:hypothetical protein